MKKRNVGASILQEAETIKPEGTFTVSCPFTEAYFEAYHNCERKIMRDVDACAEAYFSASDIRLN